MIRRSQTSPAPNISTSTMLIPGLAAGGALAVVGLRRLSQRDGSQPLRRTITIDRTPDDLRRLWQDPETLTRVMGDLGDVEPIGPERARFTRRGRLGRTAQAEGEVRFQPGPEEWGTEVTVAVDLPDGKVTRVALHKGLRRLKSLAETGELPSTDRNPAAR